MLKGSFVGESDRLATALGWHDARALTVALSSFGLRPHIRSSAPFTVLTP